MPEAATEPLRLVAVDDLGDTHVTVVDTPHGKLAVGLSGGEPFAVSNACHHLRGPLGDGLVADDGTLECPWHHARYNVHTGKMTRGPQGVFKPLAGVVKGTTGSIALKTYPVEVRDGAIWLKS